MVSRPALKGASGSSGLTLVWMSTDIHDMTNNIVWSKYVSLDTKNIFECDLGFSLNLDGNLMWTHGKF